MSKFEETFRMRYFYYRLTSLVLFSVLAFISQAQPMPLRINYAFDDSLKATSFYCEITIPKSAQVGDHHISCGLSNVLLGFSNKGTKSIVCSFYGENSSKDSTSKKWNTPRWHPFAIGENVKLAKVEPTVKEVSWNYPFQEDSTYAFLITAMPDSVETYYTTYFFEPKIKKWKMLAGFQNPKDGKYLQGLYSLFAPGQAQSNTLKIESILKNPWIQTEDKQWHSLAVVNPPDTSLHPIVDLYKNLDSATQAIKETQAIKTAVAKGTLKKANYKDGLYYEILKEGTGKHVSLTDTVTALYKGSILNGEIFDQTEKEPATFPLNRLIKGWQIGVPLCKVGGKIRLVIPSALAYSIRTRSSKIPPNSILVFDIEVVGVK